jgi:hypothetical protein
MSYIHHFIHLYFFTEFEILFYIYYILPYEKQLVYDMFDVNKLIGRFDDDLVTNLINNISNINSKSGSNNYNGQCDAEQDRIDNSNNKLWTYCFIYIIFINSILCLLFVYDLILNYKLYNETKDCKTIKQNQSNQNNEKKYNSQSSLTAFGSGNKLDINYKKTDNISSFEIDMIDLELELPTSVSNSPINILEKGKCKGKSISNYYCIYYWNNSVLVVAMCNTLKFILFIGVFEYLFFVFIINKFKIVNSELLLCKLFKEL